MARRQSTFDQSGIGNLRKSLDVREVNRSIWSLCDQGIVSAGNFFTTLALAQTLVASEYGVFVLLFGVILVLNTVHAAVVTYPLSVEGATAELKDLRKLTSSSLLLSSILLVPFTGVIAAATIALHRSVLLPVVVVAALSWQLQETLRRSLMAHLRHRDALVGDIAMYGTQVALIFSFRLAKDLTVQRAFFSILLSGLCGALVHYLLLKPSEPSIVHAWCTGKSFWSRGKWALYANSANSATTQSFFWVIARHGSSQAGTLQALVNLLAFTNPVAFSLGNVVVPTVAQVRARRAGRGFKVASQFVMQGLVLLLPYYLLLLIVPKRVLHVAYGANSMYSSFSGSLRVLVLAFAMAYFGHLLGCFLYGAQDSVGVFRTQLVSSTVAAIGGFPLTIKFGVTGAVVAMLLTHGVRLTALSRRIAVSLRSPLDEKASAVTVADEEVLSEVDCA